MIEDKKLYLSQIGLKIPHTFIKLWTQHASELYNYKLQPVGGSLHWTSNEYGISWIYYIGFREQQMCITYFLKKTFWSFIYTVHDRLAVWVLDWISDPLCHWQAWSSLDTHTWCFSFISRKRINFYLDIWILKFTVLP